MLSRPHPQELGQYCAGVDAWVAQIIGLAPRHPYAGELDRPEPNADTVPFVEPKRPDWDRIAEICALSADAQRWANFGPVSVALGKVIERLLHLPDDRAVVPASSATAALQAIAGMHAVRAGRSLVWAISAFGFFSTAIGPFAGRIRIVDCDRSGFLDLDLLARLDPESWDGLIVTNVFGLTADFSRYEAFCEARGKPLVIDSAFALPAPRPKGAKADAIISFHHTKPWGFGEGGCAIVNLENASLVRSFLNFGVGADNAFAAYAANGKMSDIAAAAILERLERMPSWSGLYQRQRRRIVGLVEAAGLDILGTPPETAISAHIPVLAPQPVTLEALLPARFVSRKYYRPLAPGFAVAEEIYARVINVPCHPAMAAVPTAEIEAFFAALKSGPLR